MASLIAIYSAGLAHYSQFVTSTDMRKSKTFHDVRFSVETLQKGLDEFLELIPHALREGTTVDWQARDGNEAWRYDSAVEFFADYRKGWKYATVDARTRGSDLQFYVSVLGYSDVEVSVQAPTRADVESVHSIFEAAAHAAHVPPPPSSIASPTVFIGHGGSRDWRDLKDHLQDQHGYDVEAYETGARAGHAIRDILEDMLSKSSFALLVLTAEDETATGKWQACQNVIHELGLFQGRLGFGRAIILLEEGTDEFSNIQGIQQLRFARGRIREIFGDVLATLKREFGR